MLPPPDPEFATAAVTALVPFLKEGATELAKKLGASVGEHLTSLYNKVKTRLTHSGKEALADLEKAPADADAQAALRLQLRKQLANDPGLQADLAELLQELRSGKTGDVLQSISTVGDDNFSIQISGSGNQVSGFGKPS